MITLSPDAAWYEWHGLNSELFLFINGLDWPMMDTIMLGFTALSHPATYPFAIATVLILNQAKPNAYPATNLAVFALSYIVASAIAVPALKDLLDFPRPATTFGAAAIRLLGTPDVTHSFPSGHAAFATLTAASLAPRAGTSVRLVLFAFAFLSCLSRIWVGAHYPADVLGGALIGLATVALSRAAIKRLTR